MIREEKSIISREQVSLIVKRLTRGNADKWTFITFNVEGIPVYMKVYNGYLQILRVGDINGGELYFDTKLQLVKYVEETVRNYLENLDKIQGGNENE